MAVSKSRMLQFAQEINSGKWIDDHSGQEINIAAVALLSIGDERHHIVPLLKDSLFCINGSSKDSDGIWHLSSWALSGNMDSRGVSIEEAIEAFNESYLDGDMLGRIHKLELVKEF